MIEYWILSTDCLQSSSVCGQQYLFLVFNIVFLIVRLSCLILFASTIFENSQKPLRTLRSIPSEGWFQESERFNQQLRNAKESTALSGKNFFYLTRRLMFGMAGTMFTYELVVLQFIKSDNDYDNLIHCK